MLGLVREARGERDAAYEAFRTAHDSLEQLRSHLRADDLKVAFLEDKMAVYESLVTACLERSGDRCAQEDAFAYIEHAKSRSLADLIAFRATSLAPRVAGPATEDVRRLRQQLNWHYRQIDLEQLGQEASAARRADRLRQRARTLEKQLAGALEEAGRTDQEFSALQSGTSAGLDEIRAILPPDAILLEYLPGARTVLRLRPDAGPSRGGAAGRVGGGPQSPAAAAVSTLEAPPGAGLRRRLLLSRCGSRPRPTFVNSMRC